MGTENSTPKKCVLRGARVAPVDLGALVVRASRVMPLAVPVVLGIALQPLATLSSNR
jgi:hypothetical protein